MSTEWSCLRRNYDFAKHHLDSIQVFDHPLKQLTVTLLESRGKSSRSLASSNASSTHALDLSLALDGGDPLSHFAQQDATDMDPLSQMAAEYEANNGGHMYQNYSSPLEECVEPWIARRAAILSKYTTSEKLSIVTSFLSGGESIKTQTTVTDKVKHRLEQLDEFDEGSVHTMDVSQQEYVLKIEQLNHELVQAWNGDQRVKALKIAIQCSKLLADTTVMQFYPSKFVLITDILDIFGKLVYERLRTKAEFYEPGSNVQTELPVNFTPAMVPESAKETCQNWFYKIASIRELLPRLYVEMAILKSYSFLTTSEFNQALLRLTHMIRGVGDPLIAVYARCYLCRVGMTVSAEKDYITANLNDFFSVYQTIFNAGIKSELLRQHLTPATYLSLYSPALDWIMQGFAVQRSDIMLDEIVDKCRDRKNNGLLLQSMLTSFKTDYIGRRARQFVNILATCSTDGITKSQLFRSLGQCLSGNMAPAEKYDVLNDAWHIITSLTHTGEYMSCIEMWAQFTSKHFGTNEVNTFLGDILSHISPNRAYEKHYGELQSIIDKIVTNTSDFDGLLALDNFLPVIDLLQKESIKLAVCKNLMNTYKSNSEERTSDPVVINALMYICRVLNDSVNALTVDDERRNISQLICNFIKRVDYGRDFQKQLDFYVDARATFPNLDTVLTALIYCVNRLAVNTKRIVRGQHSRKTGAFVRACAAYCFITIPSLESVIVRMDLYLLSGQVALMNLCLGQADACFEAGLNLIPELPKHTIIDGKNQNTDSYLVSYLSNFLSTLIIVPDSPEKGVLYLIRHLLEVFRKYPWDPNTTGYSLVYLQAIDTLSVSAQESYPYHIEQLVSNDELYGSDAKFLNAINELCAQIVDQMLEHLKSLAEAQKTRAQCVLCLELFRRIVNTADLTKDKMYTLACNLWSLAMKNRTSVDLKYAEALIDYVEFVKRRSTAANCSDEYLAKIDALVTRIRRKM